MVHLWWHGAEAEARDGSWVGVRTYLKRTKGLARQRRLVAKPEDEHSRLDFFRREQVEAAGLPP